MPQQYGPFRKDKDSDDHWQLDGTNDYWLHFEGDQVRLNCRHGASQERVCEAMIALFHAKYDRT